jgi:hypothetical protein
MITQLLNHVCSILLRVDKQQLFVKSGTVAFTVGETVTGQSSHKTGVVSQYIHNTGSPGSGTEAGYLLLTDTSGAFTDGESLVGSVSGRALANGTNAAYTGEGGKPEYDWTDEQTNVSCRMYYGTAGYRREESGEIPEKSIRVILPSTATVSADGTRRISTSTTGFSGTYDIMTAIPVNGLNGVDHYEIALKVVN